MVHLKAGEWITVSDAADILDVTARRVQGFIAGGKLKATKMGGRIYLLLRSDVEEFAKVDRPKGRPKKGKK